MNKLPNPKDIIKSDKYDSENRDGGYFDIATILEMMKEYGRQVRDLTLEWAAENVREYSHDTYDFDGEYLGSWNGVDKESILNGKTDRLLEI